MSEQATEAPPGGGGGGSFLTRTYGGIPVWGYLFVVGVGAAGIIYFKRKQSAAAATAATTATAAPATCQDANGNPVDCNSLLSVTSEGQAEYEQISSQLTGISGQDAALQAAIAQQQGSSSSGTGSTGTGTGSGGGSTGGGSTTPPKVTIPVTYGERASSAISKIEAAGLTVSTNPQRDPSKTYVSIGSSPEGGRQVPKGSHIILNVKPGL